MKFCEVLCRSALGVMATLSATLLVACGGGERVDPFVPQKIVAFGDESSFIASDGRKYTINAFNTATPPVLDCKLNPIWVQYLAASFGMSFQQCPPNAQTTTFDAVNLAATNARVADVRGAIDNYLAGNTVNSKHLFTVYVGQNDVIAVFEDASISNKVAAVEALGEALAQQVNRLALAGGRVLFVPIPDVSLTPYARQQSAQNQALLKTMSAQFNTKLIRFVINDGRAIGLVSAEEMSQVIAANPAFYGYTNVTAAACSASMPACTNVDADLIESARANKGASFFWSGDRYMSPAAHVRLGQIADTRARNNPF